MENKMNRSIEEIEKEMLDEANRVLKFMRDWVADGDCSDMSRFMGRGEVRGIIRALHVLTGKHYAMLDQVVETSFVG